MKIEPAHLTALILAAFLVLTGCSHPSQALPPTIGETTSATLPQAQPTTIETVPRGIVLCEDTQAIFSELADAILHLRQPWEMDITALGLENPELDVKNIYYSLTGQRPELKYAYDINGECEEGILRCTISYMPYKTGDFPEDFSGVEVSSLEELIHLAETRMGDAPAAVRIADQSLPPDLMNRALSQVGSGYLYCALNQDGTEITYSSPAGMTIQACLQAMAEEERLARELVSGLVWDSMPQMEKAQVLYAFLTENVSYDQRYYSDLASMPYESQTALGALRDGVAICGGYSNALRLLFTQVGIPCYTVSGKSFGQTHMWNAAQVDGVYIWFDATADRGLSPEKGFRHFALTELDGNSYQWDDPAVTALTGLQP